MTLKSLRDSILAQKIPDSLIIFETGKEGSNKQFLIQQYITEIAKAKNTTIEYLDTLEIQEVVEHLYESLEYKPLEPIRVYKTKELDVKNDSLIHEDRLIIITEKVEINSELPSDVTEFFNSQTITVPALEEWQVIDYIMSLAEGLTEDQAKWMYAFYGGDLFRINMELEKLALFLPYEQGRLVDEMQTSEVFECIPPKTIYEITNALSRRDVDKIASLYKYRDLLIRPGSEMGFIGLVYKTFKDLILVKTANNPTPEGTGLSQGQIWAISKIPNVYSMSKIAKIFDLVASMDKQIKNGEFDVAAVNIVDYLIIKILTI